MRALQPKAPVYGGWESVEPWIEIRCHGHTLGHYLDRRGVHVSRSRATRASRSASTTSSRSSRSARRRPAAGSRRFPTASRRSPTVSPANRFAGVPWYTTHKVLAGLRDAHLHRGSRAGARGAGASSRTGSDAARRTCPTIALQKMLDREHGGMNEVLADVFAITGDERFAWLAHRFSHRALLRSARARSGHARRPACEHADPQGHRLQPHRTTSHGMRRRTTARAARFFWRTVVEQRSFATGGHGDDEHFFPRARVRAAPGVGEDDGDLLHAQHAAAHAFAVRSAIRDVALHRLFRTRAVQRHPRVAGSRHRE